MGRIYNLDALFILIQFIIFSIGLYKMNMDGTYIMKENGLPDETYSFDDIVSYARAWTGLSDRKERGGVSVAER